MKPIVKTILITGLITGTLDITSAFITVYLRTHQFANKMFHYIAGGVLGLKQSMQGGAGVVVLGIFIHYFIAFSFTIFFFFLYFKIPFLRKHAYIWGFLYGIFIWAVMNLLVLPLTPLPPNTIRLQSSLIAILVLGIAIGLPSSIAVSNYYRKNLQAM